jgi:hypothetical protein
MRARSRNSEWMHASLQRQPSHYTSLAITPERVAP